MAKTLSAEESTYGRKTNVFVACFIAWRLSLYTVGKNTEDRERDENRKEDTRSCPHG